MKKLIKKLFGLKPDLYDDESIPMIYPEKIEVNSKGSRHYTYPAQDIYVGEVNAKTD